MRQSKPSEFENLLRTELSIDSRFEDRAQAAYILQDSSFYGFEDLRLNSTFNTRYPGMYQPQRTLPTKPDPCSVEISAMSEAAKKAAAALSLCGARWQDRISLNLLKKEWRRLARSVHPDLNPEISPEAFVQIHENYKILLNEVKIRYTK